MKFFEVSNFFFCGSLKTGGLSIGYLSLAIDILTITYLGLHWFAFIPDLLVTIPMLYGIHKNRPGWMTPAVVLSILSVVVLLLSISVAMPVFGFVFWRETRDFILQYPRVHFNMPIYDAQEFFMLAWAALAVFTVIQWYVTAVLYSLQQSIKNERKTNARYNLTVGKV